MSNKKNKKKINQNLCSLIYSLSNNRYTYKFLFCTYDYLEFHCLETVEFEYKKLKM